MCAKSTPRQSSCKRLHAPARESLTGTIGFAPNRRRHANPPLRECSGTAASTNARETRVSFGAASIVARVGRSARGSDGAGGLSLGSAASNYLRARANRAGVGVDPREDGPSKGSTIVPLFGIAKKRAEF